MTRILHVADLHQGRLTWSVMDDGIPSAVRSVAKCWAAAVDIAVERQVDAVIIAGDVFDSRNPDATSLNLFASALRRLHGIEVLMIPGNHDRSEPWCVLELFHRPDDGVRVSTRPEIVDLAGLKVGTLPSVGHRRLMPVGEAVKARGADVELVEGLHRILAWYAQEKVDVVVGHWSVVGSVLGDTETDVSIIDEPMIHPAALAAFQYAAFGHLHRWQEIPMGDQVVGAYSGSIDRMSFSEENDEKVALEVELGKPGATAMIVPHPLPARCFVTVKLKIDEPNMRETSNYLAAVSNPGAIVRLQVHEGAESGEAELVRRIKDAGAQTVAVQRMARQRAVPRDAGMKETLGPVEALDRWMELKGTDPELRPRVRARAEDLVRQ